MLALPERIAKKAISLVIKSSDIKIELMKDMLRNSLESNAVKIGLNEFVPINYEIFLPSEEMRKRQGLLPQIKNELECFINKFAAENGFETTSPITVVFRESDREDNSVKCHFANIEAKLDVDNATCTASIEDVKSHQEYQLLLNENKIGRASDNDITITDPSVSAHHAVIEADSNRRWFISDLNSKNRLLLNYKPVKNSYLIDGDVIQMGRVTAVFKLARGVN